MKKMICRLPQLINQWNSSLHDNAMGKEVDILTQRNLAKKTEIAYTTINRLYNNNFSRVDVNTIETLCNFFACGLLDLFSLEDIQDSEDSEKSAIVANLFA